MSPIASCFVGLLAEVDFKWYYKFPHRKGVFPEKHGLIEQDTMVLEQLLAGNFAAVHRATMEHLKGQRQVPILSQSGNGR